MIKISRLFVVNTAKFHHVVGCMPAVSSRGLKSSPDGSAYIEERPWPWRQRNFNMLYEWMGERTLKRFNENSKSIAVMGSLSSGKSAFAQKFAKEFGLLYAPDITNDELWTVQPYGFDIRSMREHMPSEQCKNLLYDLEQFYTEEDPTGHSDSVLSFMRLFYQKRFLRYVDNYLHLFSTGQGIVVDSSPYSTLAYAHAYHDCGYIDKHALNFMESLYTNTVSSFFRPHIFYYLDVPVSKQMQNIKKRAVSWESNSPVVNERFLSALDSAYKQVVFPQLKRYSEIFILNEEDVKDWPIIVEEAENLNLEPEDQHLTASEKFKDWADLTEEKASRIRRLLSSRMQWFQLMQEQGLPVECPKSFVVGDHFTNFQKIIYEHPAMKYWPGWNSRAGDKGVLLGKLSGKKTYAYYEDLEYDVNGWDPVRPLLEQWKTKGYESSASVN